MFVYACAHTEVIMKRKVVTFGEVLLRLSAPGNKRFTQSGTFDAAYGGSEGNVAASLSKFGVASSFVTAVPDNELGASALSFFESFGVDTFFSLKGEKRLGLYFLEQGASMRPGKVIYDRADSSFAALQPGSVNWKELLKDATWFHWSGISPALNSSLAAVCLEALQVASDLGITISADLNYRANLWNYGKKPSEVMPELIQYCDVLLGGKGDSELVLGIPVKEEDSLEEVFRQWKKQFPRLTTIASTGRTDANASQYKWEGYLWQEGKLYSSRQYEITHIVDRVGAGDSYMAGIIYGLIKNQNDVQKVVDFATAASCLKHTIPGDVNLAVVSEVEKLMEGDTGGRISR